MGKQIPNNRNGNQTADNALLVFSEIEILRAPVTKEQCEYCCNKLFYVFDYFIHSGFIATIELTMI